MIALVGLTCPGCGPGFVEIETLPRPPALSYSGFLIHCRHVPDGLIEWIVQMRASREHLPICGVVDPGDPFLYALAESDVQLRPLLRTDEISNGRISTAVLHRFREATVEGLILETWRAERKDAGQDTAPEAGEALSAVVAVGPGGGNVPTLARCLGLKRSALYRRFEELGLPPPAAALRRARHESVQIRIEQFGMDEATARKAAGWSTARAYEKARHRYNAPRDKPG